MSSTKTWLAALVGAAIGSGGVALLQKQLDGAANGKAPASSASALALGAQASGEISKQSLLNVSDGSRSQMYRVTAKKGDLLKIQVNGALDARLSVLRDGFLLANSTSASINYCGGHYENNSRLLLQSQLYFQSDADGEYEVAVSGAGPYAFGPYKVEVNALDVSQSTGAVALQLDQPVSAVAVGQAQDYTVTIQEAGLYTVALQSCEFDGYLRLTGQGVEVSDDDSGGTYDPKLQVWLEPGTYTVKASANGDSMRGPYVLTLGKEALPAGTELRMSGAIRSGQPVVGLLGSTQAGPNYSFELENEARVTLMASSANVDVYLTLESDSNSWSDDDSGGGARGTDARISETLPPGQYHVYVGGYGQGLFTLHFDASGR